MTQIESRPSRRPLAGLVPLLALTGLALGLWLGLRHFPTPAPTPLTVHSATLLQQPRPLAPFALTAHDGSPFDLADLRGQWSFLSFGYTHCPDICPTTLATFNAVDAQVQEQGLSAQFTFVSVDPERDTLEKLEQYVTYFNPGFRGVTGTHEGLKALTGQLGVLYARAEQQDTAMGYLVDHSASVLLIDPLGRLAAVFGSPHDPATIAQDFVAITTQ